MIDTSIIPDAVVDYIKASIRDAYDGGDTSSEPWDRVVRNHRDWADALREWYDETGAEDDDPRFALAFVLRTIKRYNREEQDNA
jgi:hypothetical protein